MMTRAAIFLLLCAATALSGESGTVQINPEELVWKDGPPTLPPGAKSALLEGDARTDGIFTLRLELPASYKLATHTHPAAERVTVLSGSILVVVPPATARRVKAGGFYVTAAGVPHSISTDEKTVIQLTGAGPWGIQYANPADDPRGKK